MYISQLKGDSENSANFILVNNIQYTYILIHKREKRTF